MSYAVFILYQNGTSWC